MPALSYGRQPEAARSWFDTPAGQAVLASESAAMVRLLSGRPALPWAWFGLPAATAPMTSDGRGVTLVRDGGGFSGSLRCSLPLPLATESLGVVLLQHVIDGDDDIDGLLDECARVLIPGGMLWLAALNPWTPYRLRWTGSGLRARAPGQWQAVMRGAGFATDSLSLQWLGPHWRPDEPTQAGVAASDRLRAAFVLTASKRAHALVPPTPLRQLRWHAGGALRRDSAARTREDCR